MQASDRAARIQAMFGRIARRYDVMNRVMTGGRDEAWRRAAARELALGANARVLDLATGTGDLAFAVRRMYPTARVAAFDFSEGILRVGEHKRRARGDHAVAFGVGDALRLPFPDQSFDACVNGFLLRNAVDLPLCLREMRRVVRPGGRVVCMEITHPQTPVFRELFKLYFYRVVPVIGGIVAGDPAAYTYLPNSLTQFPPAEPLRAIMLDAGYREVAYRLLGLGTMAIHTGLV